MKLDPRQAHYVLEVLVARGKVRASHVRGILEERRKEIAGLRERLAMLESIAGAVPAAGSAPGRPGRRKMSPRLRALRRQQGQYMGFTRRLKPAQKARVRAVREKSGLAAAIRLAASLGRS